MTGLAAAAASLLAFLLFGLATERHHGERFGRRLSAQTARRWRGYAWMLLVLSYAAASAAWGLALGPVAWAGLAMAAAAGSFLFLNLVSPAMLLALFRSATGRAHSPKRDR